MLNASSLGMVVRSPLLTELESLEYIAKNVNDQIKGKIATIADLIDLDFIRQTVQEVRNELLSKASQRITDVGYTGSGKSTTLNLMLCSSIIDDYNYQREWHRVFPAGFERTPPQKFCFNFFGEPVSFLQSFFF